MAKRTSMLRGYIIRLSCGHAFTAYPILGRMALPRIHSTKRCGHCPGRKQQTVVSVQPVLATH